MTDYTDWKILKTELPEKQDEYNEVSNWCNDNQEYFIYDDGVYYKTEKIPTPTIEEQNEIIRHKRQERYLSESDPIRLDYDEALARGEETAEQLKQEWLASKDKIREELPYVEEEDADVGGNTEVSGEEDNVG